MFAPNEHQNLNSSQLGSVIGGKAKSLLQLQQAQFSVPPWIALTTEFFKPWFESIVRSSEWAAIQKQDESGQKRLSAELVTQAQIVDFNKQQNQIVQSALSKLGQSEFGYAVRSSAPDEDSAAASYAGIYESFIAVPSADLKQAIRDCFASCFSVSALSYHSHQCEKGQQEASNLFAVIIQLQINSEIAGVANSIHPTNNDYDEISISANFGQCESVVRGIVEPDHYIVNKHELTLVGKTLGSKSHSVRLCDKGGSKTVQENQGSRYCLQEPDVIALAQTVSEIESAFKCPVEVEWSWLDEEFQILQARPVTRWVPLPKSMLTKPGEPRQLYLDRSLAEGMTMNAPISELGLDLIKQFEFKLCELTIGPFNQHLSISNSILFHAGNRIYANLSNLLWITTPKKLEASRAPFDALLGSTLGEINEDIYKSQIRPKYLRFWKLRLLPGMLWKLRPVIKCVMRGARNPEKAKQDYVQESNTLEVKLLALDASNLKLDEFIEASINLVTPVLLYTMLPTLGALVAGGNRPLERLFKTANPETKLLAESLKQGFSENIVVEMGVALYELANLLPDTAFDDLDALASNIQNRELSQEFLTGWDQFIAKYGNRGPMEMDIASARFADSPILAVKQLASLRDRAHQGSTANSLQGVKQEERKSAEQTLMAQLSSRQQKRLQKINRVFTQLAGLRDSPKHTILTMIGMIRKRCLQEGERLVQQGKLKNPTEIFALTLDQIRNPNSDFSEAVEHNSRFRNTLATHARKFPSVIDSRGRILLPEKREEASATVFSGMPASPGKVSGKVKLLESIDGTPVKEGDIIVAYVTDPGWTPLFLRASAVILEIGGSMQHGVVIAREFGKPCVTSIAGIVDKLEEGQHVEVDGTAGLVRLLD